MSPAVHERFGWLETISLESGAHESLERGACVMEAVAYIAGEPWSDHPVCACPVLTSFMVAWNDGLQNDAERDRLLKPLVEQLIDTRSTPAVEERRSYMALDWLIRVTRRSGWISFPHSRHMPRRCAIFKRLPNCWREGRRRER